MEVFTSQLPAKAYCRILRMKLDSPFYVFDERMNGVVIGTFFSLCHHAPWEWNEKITSECSRAWGYVREKNGVTQIHFIRGKGLLAPSWMLFFTLVSMFCIYAAVGELPPAAWYASIGIALAVGIFTAITDSLTEDGIAGAGEITRILKDPKEYYC